MDTFSSGEDLFMKTRKPYTITKQRERWTDEEHIRFIEALKLYGRAWQRIEDHIGTKTAVQIRSHAQKFFTKLEKEALLKGIPTGQALEIDIPPPRPKRKPSNPYPRKTGVGAPFRQVEAEAEKSSTPVSSLCPGKQILDLEREPLSEQPGGDEKPGNAKENQDENTCSETLTLSSANETSMATKSLDTFGELVPVTKEASLLDETNESHVTFEPEGNQKLVKLDTKQTVHNNETGSTSNVQSSKPSREKLIQGHKTDQTRQPGDFGELPSNDTQATQTYPIHVPVHVLDRCLLMSIQNVPASMPHQESIFHQVGGLQAHPNLLTYPGASSTTGPNIKASRPIPQSFPPSHPLFTPPCTNEDDYRAYCHGYSTFSSLIVSTLQQNPAAHAAASLAATFLPGAKMEASVDTPASILGGFPSRQVNPAPSMAAIAAATVAAANAWWAAHGLLPSCTPFCSCFTCAPAPATVTSTENGRTPARNTDKDLLSQSQQLDPELSVSLQGKQPGSKLPILSSEDSEEIGGKPNTESSAADTKKAAAVTELCDPEKKSRKPVDRSSCGSNTASSSEVETDALEKHEKDEEDLKEPGVSYPDDDSNSHRCRSSSQANDSWKEVSQEGRLAFQALFSRGKLPQSFSPPHYLKSKSCQNNIEKDNHNAGEKTEDAELDLNSMTWGTFSIHQAVEHYTRSRGNNIGEEGMLTMGLGHGKLKSRRTGFKPYKRCSVEANESRVGSTSNQGDEKGPKRIRLEGEAAS